VVDPRILGCVPTHTPQNADNSTGTPNEPEFSDRAYLLFML